MKKKITYIVFGLDKAPAFEWIINRIDTEKYALSFIFISAIPQSHLQRFCQSKAIPNYYFSYSGKKDILFCCWKVFWLLRSIQPNAVHAHIFEGGLIGITAAFFAGIKNRIYTRHYSTFHHQFHPNGIKYDKIINRLSTQIIAISNNVKEVLINMEHVPENKITLIRHGFDLNHFYADATERVQHIKQKYQLQEHAPIIGVISRYTILKGIQYIIPAFQQLLQKYPRAVLVLANAKGEYKADIQKQLSTLPSNSFREIEFENDNVALFKTMDVFIHVPINSNIEAFGQTYIEALAAGIPSVFTLSGVAAEFIENKKNAIVVDFENSQQIYEAILSILENETLRQTIIENGKQSLHAFFSLTLMIEKLETLYSKL